MSLDVLIFKLAMFALAQGNFSYRLIDEFWSNASKFESFLSDFRKTSQEFQEKWFSKEYFKIENFQNIQD